MSARRSLVGMSSSHEGSAQQEQVNAETQVTQPETQTSQGTFHLMLSLS